MHDATLRGEALRAACSFLSKHPNASLSDALRAEFASRPELRDYLRQCRYEPGYPTAVGELLDTAASWLEAGQFSATASLYERWHRDGTFASLSDTDRAVLHALLMLAMRSGPQLIASTRYVGILLDVQFGVTVSHVTVRSSYCRLESRHLLEVIPGAKGRTRRSATTIEFRSVLTSVAGSWPSDQALSDLTMSSATLMALGVYRVEAYAARSAVHAAPGPLQPSSATVGVPAGGR